MAWQTVAEGTSLDQLAQLVADMELPKGARVKVVMNTWAPWLFDMAGAELLFPVPEGLDMVDVWGEGGKAYAELEADPAWLVATLAFIGRHWVGIIIAGFLISLLISFVVVMVKVPAIFQLPIWLMLGAVAGVVALAVVGTRKGYEVRRKET